MRISYHDQQVLNRLRDGAEDSIWDVVKELSGSDHRVRLEMIQAISPILVKLAKEAYEWGYSKRDAEQEWGYSKRDAEQELGPAPEEGDYR